MNAEERAWDEFRASDNGVRCLNPTTLGVSDSQRPYLANRMWKAFTRGMEAGKRIACRRIAAAQKRLIETAAETADDE